MILILVPLQVGQEGVFPWSLGVGAAFQTGQVDPGFRQGPEAIPQSAAAVLGGEHEGGFRGMAAAGGFTLSSQKKEAGLVAAEIPNILNQDFQFGKVGCCR